MSIVQVSLLYSSLCTNTTCLNVWLLYLHSWPAWLLLISEPTCKPAPWSRPRSVSVLMQILYVPISLIYQHWGLGNVQVLPSYTPAQPLCLWEASPGNPDWSATIIPLSCVVVWWSCLKCVQMYPSQPITALSPQTLHTLGSVSVNKPLKIHHMI